MLTLYVVLIPLYRGMGAALATLGGFLFLAAATHFVSQRVFYVRYPWARLVGLLALAVVVWLAGWGLPAAPWAIVAKAGLWLGVLPLAWITRLVSADEKLFVRDGLARLFARWRRPAALSLTADR